MVWHIMHCRSVTFYMYIQVWSSVSDIFFLPHVYIYMYNIAINIVGVNPAGVPRCAHAKPSGFLT